MAQPWLRLCSIVALSASIGSLAATSAGAQSLDEEIGALLRNHPQLKGLRNQVEASEEGINRAFAGYLPTVEFTGDYGYEHTDSPARRASTPDGEHFSTARTKATVTVTENLFNGFRTPAEYKASKLTKRGSEISLDNTTQNVIFEGVAAYLDVLRNRALVDLAAQNEEVIKTQLNLENERVARGSGIALDVLQSKARLQIARERRVAFEGELANAVTRYTQVFGHGPDIEAMANPELDPTLMPLTVDDAVAVAVVEHPEAENSANLIELAQTRRRTSKSPYFPKLDLVGKWNYEDNVDGIDSIRRDYSVVVRANWQLFAGFATRASVAESAYQYAASVDNRNFVNQKIVEDVHLAWENLQTAQRRLALLENAVNIAIEVHAARGKLREAGKETVLNVLDAQNEVFNAQINQVAADYDARTAAYRLVLAMGRLDAEHLTPGLAQAEPAAETVAAAEPAEEPAEAVAETIAVEEPVEPVAATVAVEEPVVPAGTETLAALEPVMETTDAALAEEAALGVKAEEAEPDPALAEAKPAAVTETVYITGSGATVEPASVEVPASVALDPNFSRSWSFE
jgi:adhesin transport system outer membrane protein